MIWVGIIGAKGYFGEALARLVAGHPEAQVSTLLELQDFGGITEYTQGEPADRPGYWNMVNAVKKADIIFNGLPGTVAGDVYESALSNGKRIIDISDEHHIWGSFEANSGNAYPGSIYGLSELYREKIKDAAIVSNPSGYCTGAILGLAPLAAGKMVDINSAAIESKSGITNLKRTDRLIESNMAAKGGLKTYKVANTDYAEEVNGQMLELFGERTAAAYTPYIIPGTRGITTTIIVSPQTGISGSDVIDIYKDFYKSNPSVEICNKGVIPEIKAGFSKCFCKIGASVNSDSGKITVTTVLDDAIRGVASQAIQSMNLMCGIDGKIGL